MSEVKNRSVSLLIVLGFVIAFISIFGYYFVGNAATIDFITKGGGAMVMLLWALMCAVAFLMCFYGWRKSFSRLRMLALAGMAISAMTFALSIWSASSIYQAASNPELEKLQKHLEEGENEELKKLKQRLDKRDTQDVLDKDSIVGNDK